MLLHNVAYHLKWVIVLPLAILGLLIALITAGIVLLLGS